jgi:hypothetical protein
MAVPYVCEVPLKGKYTAKPHNQEAQWCVCDPIGQLDDYGEKLMPDWGVSFLDGPRSV